MKRQTPKQQDPVFDAALVLHKADKLDQAALAYRNILKLRPNHSGALNNLGVLCRKQGLFEEASSCFERVLKLNPSSADAWSNLASLSISLGKFEAAVRAAKQATKYAPAHAQGFDNLSFALFRTGQLALAEEASRRALEIEPRMANAWNNLGQILQRQSRLADASDAYLHALELDKSMSIAHANLLFCMHFDDRWSAQQIFESHSQWGKSFEGPILSKAPKFRRVKVPAGKRPRVAFISPDLCAHPVAMFLRPLISNWPHERMELGFYASVKRPDITTQWFKQNSDFWCDILPLNDEQAAQLIADDEVDVLIDLSGHTGDSRLKVLAYRPSACQMSWLGYFDTTGMQSVQYLLADPVCVSPQMESFFTEKLLRLPDDFVCFDPPADAPPISALPAMSNGYITFGSQNQLAKVTDAVLQQWAKVMLQTPNSRLLFQAQAFNDPAVHQRYSQRFAQLGIQSSRIDFLTSMPRERILLNYCNVDISLDPFPCAGGTTTCESLWMGVPVVTLLGDRFGGRHSASHLSTVGLSQMIAQDPEQYLRIVRDLCANLPALAKLRAGLREQMKASPMCDGPRFARNFCDVIYSVLNQKLTEQPIEPTYFASSIIPTSPSKDEIDALVATFKTKSQVDTIAKAKALIAKYPKHFFAWKVLSCVLHDQGQYQQAIQGFEHCLKLNSKDFESYNNLGNTYLDLQRFDKAREMYSQAIVLNPKYSTAHHNLANVLIKTGELEEAIVCYSQAISLDPSLVIAHVNMGTVLSVLGRHKEAVNCYINALKLQPEHAQSHFGLAVALQKLHFWPDAILSYRKAIEAKSDYAEAHSNYGNLLYLQGDLKNAQSSLRKAISLAPSLTQAQCNLGSVQIASGEIEEAVVTYQQALQASPDSKEVFSNLLFSMHFGNRWSMQEIYEFHLEWSQRFELPKLTQPALHQSTQVKAGKRPRVAFISPDLYAHPVTLFLRPLIANWPHERLELGFYASVKRPDDATRWFQQQSQFWVDISGLNDEKAAQRIAQDEVDVLIELSGHTGENRLSVLAHRPAPVQVSWLGYFDTTGMQSVDYLIADSVCVTPQMECFFSEKVLCLPDDFVCFDPTIDAPEVSELPARSKGHITFGSQNQLAKVTDEVLDLWAKVLEQTPQSRLMFQAKAFNDPEVIARYLNKFAQRGIESLRIDFIAGCNRQQILQNYCKLDIALDPFPCAGGTTTCESLWMGVPVVTLLGDRFGGRHSASHLSTVGLSQLIAQDPEQYLKIVRDLCADLPALAKLRAGLREQMKASPMCDGPRFAKNFEKLLFEIINLEN